VQHLKTREYGNLKEKIQLTNKKINLINIELSFDVIFTLSFGLGFVRKYPKTKVKFSNLK